jgi:DMSO/TMAO reductase YedYZ heme-binding membrane subunit
MDFILSNLAFIIIPFVYMTLVFIGKYIVKYEWQFILFAFVLSITFFFIGGQFLEWTVFSGQFSFALFLLVILPGIFKRGNSFRSVIDPVRGDLAIYGFIYLIPHSLSNLEKALGGFNTTGILASLLMVPLVITSFKFVRVKMKPSSWVSLHKLSYVAYAAIYLHTGFDLWLNPFQIYLKMNSWPVHLVTLIYIIFKLRLGYIKKVQLKTQT